MHFKTHYAPLISLESFYLGSALAVSLEGDLIACSHGDVVKIVNASSGQVVKTLSGDSSPVTSLCFGRSSSLLYGSTRALQLVCWNTSSAACLKTWKAHSTAVACLALHRSGGLLATGASDRTIRVWDTQGYFCTHVFRGHGAVVLQVVFQSEELVLISAAEDGQIRVWDLVSQKCTARMEAHFAAVTSLSLAPDGWTLLSASRDKTAVLWDLRTYKQAKLVPVFDAIEGAVVIGPARKASKKKRSRSDGAAGAEGICFATAGQEGSIKVWDSATSACTASWTPGGESGDGGQLNSLAQAESGLLVTASADARIFLLRAEPVHGRGPGAAQPAVRTTRELVGDLGEVTDLRFLGEPGAPTHLAVATNSAAVRVFDVASGRCCASLDGHADVVLALDAVLLGGGRTAVVSGGKDCCFVLWDIEITEATNTVASESVAVFKGHSGSVTAVAIRHDAGQISIVSASSDKMLKVWETTMEARSGKKATKTKQSVAGVAAHDKDINGLAISPDGRLACSASQDRTAKIWKLPSLVSLTTLRGHKRGVWSAAFSPVEQTVATASADGTVRLWALKTGACLRMLEGHAAAVHRVIYVTSGMQVMSSGADGLIKLWDARTGECATTLDGHEDRVWALDGSSAGGELVASGGSDGKVCVWRDASQEKLEEETTAKSAAVAAQQALSNALQAGDLTGALGLAWSTGRTQQLRHVIESLQHSRGDAARAILTDFVRAFSPDQLKLALTTLRDWNTHAQHAEQAQALLGAILVAFPPKALVALPGAAEVLDSLAPYLERHVAHVDRLLVSSGVLDYTLARLQHIEAEDG